MGRSWKTTLFGIVAVIPQVLPVIGLTLPMPLLNLVTAVAGAVAFFFAKDKNVTGGGRNVSRL